MNKTPSLSSEIKGNGDPLLILHGFTGDRSTMSSISEPLSKNYSVISVDLPGHGNTVKDLEPYLFNFEDTLKALIEVMEFYDLEEFNVLGYSMGGRLSLGLATKYPNKIKNTILIGATAGIADENQRIARRRSDDRLAEEILEKGVEWFVEYWMEQPIFESQIRIDPETFDASKKQRLQNNAQGLANSLRGSGTGSQPSFWRKLNEINSPTLIIVGEEDPKFRSLAVRLNSGISKSEIVVVPESGHACHLENPDFTLETIKTFLEEVLPR
jgi:2-succinyl-6-hydroxy-2,4-cyclohexadiene-1-carboxylate synthase